jgi:hypothetical protein
VDIQNWGKNKQVNGGLLCLAGHPLGPDPIDPGHFHANFVTMWDGVQMDNACNGDASCYAYVQRSDVQPYFDIAINYGFANYMFQTNEGPSFPAHQFIFSGTSAPIGVFQQTYFDWFAADNPPNGFGNKTGCSSPDPNQMDIENGIKPDGHLSNAWYHPPGLTYSYPCYDHPTLTDLLDAVPPPIGPISWKYYAPKEGSIWTAPTAISHICGGVNQGPCPYFKPGGKYASKVSFEGPNNTAPIFGDIGTCNLAAVTWVIPDMKWSDHPGATDNQGTGPDYVGNLVNAIGGSLCTNPNDGKSYWDSTAILITWDDWGGWYDHVPPFKTGGQTNGWGQSYTYGFRVPMLVVSAYTPAHYVSGNTLTQGGEVFPYIHDFGSILAFIENNFLGPGKIGQINPQYTFADAFAPDFRSSL